LHKGQPFVALIEKKKSLLPSGLREVKGQFAHGDPVDIAGPDGKAFARGLVAYSAEDLTRIAGLKSGQIESVLGWRGMERSCCDDFVMLPTVRSTSRSRSAEERRPGHARGRLVRSNVPLTKVSGRLRVLPNHLIESAGGRRDAGIIPHQTRVLNSHGRSRRA
jgi:hypothetical protein